MEGTFWNTLSKDLHLYTAYLDKQRDSLVRIVSYISCNNPSCTKRLRPLRCTYKTATGSLGTFAAYVELMEKHITRFPLQPAKVVCPFPTYLATQVRSKNLFVGVLKASKGGKPKFWIRVMQTPKLSKAKCCAVCVKPVFGRLATLHRVAEFIANYRVVGARHFFLYDAAMTEALKTLLARFQSAGIDVTVIDFKLPFNNTLVHRWGQMAALYDCMMRAVAKAEWFLPWI
ncbi:hypothetical protein HPB48_019177 [Haemaphysalis longicornis]|uniref:Glycosyltransferase family 92 protein n=1 Tax=Haemaphysalis longicornis TaxID=44386 RepID=A0A9J6G0L6_HAELO|nr:hypothetical protein HPB48_019177 [Haemaphysalis longicornis]